MTQRQSQYQFWQKGCIFQTVFSCLQVKITCWLSPQRDVRFTGEKGRTFTPYVKASSKIQVQPLNCASQGVFPGINFGRNKPGRELGPALHNLPGIKGCITRHSTTQNLPSLTSYFKIHLSTSEIFLRSGATIMSFRIFLKI